MTTVHLDPERVVHETIDGETLLIDLLSGTYFSLRDSAAEIWKLLLAHGSDDMAAAELATSYPDQAAAVGSEVQRFARELVEQGLLVPGGAGPIGPAQATSGTTPTTRSTFVAPVLETFTDMQYFLMLDPIHDADESAGWPTPALDAPPSAAA